MKKQKYLPCEVKVIMFHVEQGFANSQFSVGTEEATQYILLEQTKQAGHYQNERYNQQQDWFDFNGTNQVQ